MRLSSNDFFTVYGFRGLVPLNKVLETTPHNNFADASLGSVLRTAIVKGFQNLL